jgi:hypothetical protein
MWDYDPVTGEQFWNPYGYYTSGEQEVPVGPQQPPQQGVAEQLMGLGAGKGAEYLTGEALSSIGDALGIGAAPMTTAPVDVMASLGAAAPEAVMTALPGSMMSTPIAAAPTASQLAGYGSYLGPQAAAPGGLSSLGAYAGPGAMAAFGAYLLSNMMDKKPRTKLAEERRFSALANRGVNVDPTKYQRAFRDDLAPDFVGKDKDGVQVNNKFFRSRDVKDLTADDLLARPAVYEMFGNSDANKMRRFSEEALKRGLVSEGLGAINVNSSAQTAGLADALGLSLQGSGQRYQAGGLGQRLGDIKSFLGGKKESPFEYGDDAWKRSREYRSLAGMMASDDSEDTTRLDAARANFLRDFDNERRNYANSLAAEFGPPSAGAQKPGAPTASPLLDAAVPKPAIYLVDPSKVGVGEMPGMNAVRDHFVGRGEIPGMDAVREQLRGLNIDASMQRAG